MPARKELFKSDPFTQGGNTNTTDNNCHYNTTAIVKPNIHLPSAIMHAKEVALLILIV